MKISVPFGGIGQFLVSVASHSPNTRLAGFQGMLFKLAGENKGSCIVLPDLPLNSTPRISIFLMVFHIAFPRV